jgi:hypothetical protein
MVLMDLTLEFLTPSMNALYVYISVNDEFTFGEFSFNFSFCDPTKSR